MLVAHIWELGSTYFDYYYLSENCSYHLLAAIEVTMPELDLLGQLSYPVIPADTVKVIAGTEGLVGKVTYRPSLRSQFKSRLAELDGDAKRWVRKIADDPDAQMPSGFAAKTQVRVMTLRQI